jgi:hypothetical protein
MKKNLFIVLFCLGLGSIKAQQILPKLTTNEFFTKVLHTNSAPKGVGSEWNWTWKKKDFAALGFVAEDGKLELHADTLVFIKNEKNEFAWLVFRIIGNDNYFTYKGETAKETVALARFQKSAKGWEVRNVSYALIKQLPSEHLIEEIRFVEIGARHFLEIKESFYSFEIMTQRTLYNLFSGKKALAYFSNKVIYSESPESTEQFETKREFVPRKGKPSDILVTETGRMLNKKSEIVPYTKKTLYVFEEKKEEYKVKK